MKLMRFTKKKAVAFGLAFGVAAGAGGVAAAFFTASGTGTGKATVGSPTGFTVTAGTATGTLYPATPPNATAQATITFTIKNISSGNEHYSIGTATATIVKSTEAGHTTTIAATTAGTTAVTGCKWAWFSASSTPSSGTLAKAATAHDVVTITMSTTTTTTQTKCSTKAPFVTLSF